MCWKVKKMLEIKVKSRSQCRNQSGESRTSLRPLYIHLPLGIVVGIDSVLSRSAKHITGTLQLKELELQVPSTVTGVITNSENNSRK